LHCVHSLSKSILRKGMPDKVIFISICLVWFNFYANELINHFT
jgi:hypothetical protein